MDTNTITVKLYLYHYPHLDKELGFFIKRTTDFTSGYNMHAN